MLYQSIQAKSEELESRLFNKELKEPGEIQIFVDELRRAMPYIEDIKNYRRALIHFRKWSSILYSEFKYIYDEQIDHLHTPLEDNLDDYILRRLDLFLEVEQVTEVAGINKIISAFNEHYVPYSDFTFTADEYLSDKQQAHLIDEIMTTAERAYRKSDFDKAKSIYWKYVEYAYGKVLNKNHDTIDMIFLAWCLHSIGNIHYACQKYKSANKYYSCALKIKNSLVEFGVDKNLILLSSYSSEAKKIATSLAFPDTNVHLYQMSILDLKNRMNTHRDTLEKTNTAWLLGIETYVNYLIGKSYLYLNDRNTARMFLDQSRELAQKTGDEAAVVRAIVYGFVYRAYGKEQLVNVIIPVLQQIEASDVWMNNPNIRRLRASSISHEFRIQSTERAIEFEHICNEIKLSGLHTTKQNKHQILDLN